MNANDSAAKEVVIYRDPIWFYVLLVFGIAASIISIMGMLGIARRPNLVTEIACLSGGITAAAIGFYFVNHQPVLLEFTSTGLFIHEFHITVPWESIKLAEAIIVHYEIGGSHTEIGLQLTKERQDRYNRLMSRAVREQNPNWDLIIRCMSFRFRGTSIRGIHELAELINARIQQLPKPRFWNF